MGKRLLVLTAVMALTACNEVQVNSGPPISGFTPSTFNPARREAAQMTEESLGLPVAPRQ